MSALAALLVTAALVGVGVVVVLGVVALVVVRTRRGQVSEGTELARHGLAPLPPGRAPAPWWPLLPDRGHGELSGGYHGRWRGRPVVVGRYYYRPNALQTLLRKGRDMDCWVTGIQLHRRWPYRVAPDGAAVDWCLYDRVLLSYGGSGYDAAGRIADIEALARIADQLEPAPPR